MSTTKEIGDFYEEKAVKHYLKKGHQLLTRNFRHKKSEIDFITRKNTVVYFVEVKYRKSSEFGGPEEMVSNNQQKRIMDAAEEYILLHNIDEQIQFDVVSISNDNQVIIFEDAFS